MGAEGIPGGARICSFFFLQLLCSFGVFCLEVMPNSLLKVFKVGKLFYMAQGVDYRDTASRIVCDVFLIFVGLGIEPRALCC